MTGPTLDDALDKLRWARHHFEVLEPKLETLGDQDAHTISLKLDSDAGQYSFHIDGLQEPDTDLGLIVGDCIHNARTALDYLMVRLFALVSGQEVGRVENVQFPICSAPDKFKRTVGPFNAYPAASGYIARIEELQPYNNGNVSIWGVRPNGLPRIHALPNALDRLSKLDNIDKHRITHAVWSQVDIVGSLSSRALIPPAGFEVVAESTSAAPLENGAQVGYMTFKTPLPSEWRPSNMDMKRAFPTQVTLGEAPELYAALTVLFLCLWGVDAVLKLFEPVFASLQPPLPVTTVPNPGGQ